jgi:tRNA threonylcarbamoyladenosine biosynthesis protein TsaB
VPLVLGIDTASGRASIALARGAAVLAEECLEERGAHARDLLPRLERLLRDRGLAAADLGGIGVSVGPGSFTGVRVGMATAKGLGYALDVPCAGLSTLEALARAAAAALGSGVLCAALDAGRGEVYGALFRIHPGAVERIGEDRSWRPSDLAARVPAGGTLAGDGAAAVAREATAGGRPLPVLDPAPLLAGAIAVWAEGTLGAARGYRPGTLRPNYVRPADAEAKRRRP